MKKKHITLPAQRRKISFPEACNILSRYYGMFSVSGISVRNIRYGERDESLTLEETVRWMIKYVNPTFEIRKYSQSYIMKMAPEADFVPSLNVPQVIKKASTKKHRHIFTKKETDQLIRDASPGMYYDAGRVAIDYASKVLNGEWENGEPIIVTSPQATNEYLSLHEHNPTIQSRVKELVLKYLDWLDKKQGPGRYNFTLIDATTNWPEFKPFLSGNDALKYMVQNKIVDPQLEERVVEDWGSGWDQGYLTLNKLITKYMKLRGKRWPEAEQVMTVEQLLTYMNSLSKSFSDLEQLFIDKLNSQKQCYLDMDVIKEYEKIRGKNWYELLPHLESYELRGYVKKTTGYDSVMIDALLNQIKRHLRGTNKYEAIMAATYLVDYLAKYGIERDARVEATIKQLQYLSDPTYAENGKELWQKYIKEVIPRVGILKPGQTAQDVGDSDEDYEVVTSVF